MVIADRVEGEEMRYRLLETVRQYAAERLADLVMKTAGI